MAKSDLPPAAKVLLLMEWDSVLGLRLGEAATAPAPALTPDQQSLLERRAAARAAKDWAESDRLRDELAAQGILVKDGKEGQSWTKFK